MSGVFQNGKVCCFDTAVPRPGTFDQLVLHQSGKFVACGTAVVGLDSQCRSFPAGVEVNTYEDRISVAVGAGRALSQTEIFIASPDHHGLETGLLEKRLQSAGNVQIDVFLIHP